MEGVHTLTPRSSLTRNSCPSPITWFLLTKPFPYELKGPFSLQNQTFQNPGGSLLPEGQGPRQIGMKVLGCNQETGQ